MDGKSCVAPASRIHIQYAVTLHYISAIPIYGILHHHSLRNWLVRYIEIKASVCI